MGRVTKNLAVKTVCGAGYVDIDPLVGFCFPPFIFLSMLLRWMAVKNAITGWDLKFKACVLLKDTLTST